MRRHTLAAVLPAILLLAASARAGVTFQDLSVDEALVSASATGSFVLVDVYATWCGPCQRLDSEVFPTDVAGTATAGMIAVRVNAEEGDGPAVCDRWHVVGYPTVLLLRPDGTEVDRIFGFMPADEFASTLLGYTRGEGTIDQLRERVAAAPDDLVLVQELAERTVVRGELAAGEELFGRLIAADPENVQGLRSHAHFFLGKYGYLRGASRYDDAIEQFRIVIEQFPASEDAPGAILQTAIAHARAGRPDQVAESFDRYIATAPGESGTYNAVAWVCFQERVEIDRGIAYARRGLDLNPQDASLWDTLAELLAVAGDIGGAMDAAGRAQAIEPETEYYRRQYERFAMQMPLR